MEMMLLEDWTRCSHRREYGLQTWKGCSCNLDSAAKIGSDLHIVRHSDLEIRHLKGIVEIRLGHLLAKEY